MKSKYESLGNLRQIRLADKFLEDMSVFYPGIADPADKEALTALVHRGIDEFEAVVRRDGDEEAYREAIRKGLSYVDASGMYIDTEDRERVALYFEQMMDAVGLESSDGILNTWLYGFDPENMG